MYLLSDVKSYKGFTYAYQGDEVSVVSSHGSVAIVEDLKGNRFSTPFTNITELTVKKSANEGKKVSQKGVSKRTKEQFNNNQTQLF